LLKIVFGRESTNGKEDSMNSFYFARLNTNNMDIIDQPGMQSQGYLTMEEVERRGYRFAFDSYFNQVIELLKNNLGTYVLAALISLSISIFSSFIPFIGSFLGIFLAPGFYAGFVLISKKAADGDRPEAGDIFSGFKGNVYGRVLVTYLLFILIALCCLILAVPIIIAAGPDVAVITEFFQDAARGGQPDGEMFLDFFANPQMLWLMILIVFALVYVSVSLCLAMTFATLYSSSPTEAIRNSFRIVRKSWWWFLAYTWLLSICASLGIIALCIGFLVTYPLPFIGSFVAFDQIMKGKNPKYSA
jgi:hypothetical protein